MRIFSARGLAKHALCAGTSFLGAMIVICFLPTKTQGEQPGSTLAPVIFKHASGSQCADTQCICRLQPRRGRGSSIGTAESGVTRGQEPEEAVPVEPAPMPPLAPESLTAPLAHDTSCGCTAHGHYPTIGDKRVPVSLFEMDSTAASTVLRLRFDSAFGLEEPDRAEFYWAKVGGRGPAMPERSVDYQDFTVYTETSMADGAMGIFTEIPIRVLEPSINDNTTGLADMNTGLKTVLMDQDAYQISMILRTFVPTGLPRRGLGTGHMSMEPGVLGRWQLDEQTWCHGELKYWFPIGGDPEFSGPIIRYGVGFTHVLAEWNEESVRRYKAIIPTLEFIGWAVMDGMETNPDGTTSSPDPAGIFNVQPGVRVVCGKHMDFGVSAAFAATNEHWYDQLFRFEFRWFY